MRKIIILTLLACALGIVIGWIGMTMATWSPVHGAVLRPPAAASISSPTDMMRHAGRRPAQATSDRF